MRYLAVLLLMWLAKGCIKDVSKISAKKERKEKERKKKKKRRRKKTRLTQRQSLPLPYLRTSDGRMRRGVSTNQRIGSVPIGVTVA